jgi:hypothetical protein
MGNPSRNGCRCHSFSISHWERTVGATTSSSKEATSRMLQLTEQNASAFRRLSALYILLIAAHHYGLRSLAMALGHIQFRSDPTIAAWLRSQERAPRATPGRRPATRRWRRCNPLHGWAASERRQSAPLNIFSSAVRRSMKSCKDTLANGRTMRARYTRLSYMLLSASCT